MTDTLVDQPGDVRQDDALDVEAIRCWLKEQAPGVLEHPDRAISVKQFAGGASNLTYQISFGDQTVIMRRPPSGTKPKSGHDMGREFSILSKLEQVFPYCPKPLAFCEDTAVIGAPFYLMEKLEGIIVRRELPKGMHLSADDASTLCKHLTEVHAQLHELDPVAAGLQDFGKPEGYVGRQVAGWNGRYDKAKTPDVPQNPVVMQWLSDKQPADSARSGIIHNDFKLDNVVLDPNNPLKIIGVLDWEMATLGDPLMDLGSSLAYWVQPDDPQVMQMARMMPTHLPGMWGRRQVADHYAQYTGRAIEAFDFYYVFGLFRLAVIAQQIYYRFYHGQTTNKRFAMFGQIVPLLIGRAEEIIKQSDL